MSESSKDVLQSAELGCNLKSHNQEIGDLYSWRHLGKDLGPGRFEPGDRIGCVWDCGLEDVMAVNIHRQTVGSCIPEYQLMRREADRNRYMEVVASFDFVVRLKSNV